VKLDAGIVLDAGAFKRDWPVLTSDPDDLLAIDQSLAIERI
jgi:hypothetical protein